MLHKRSKWTDSCIEKKRRIALFNSAAREVSGKPVERIVKMVSWHVSCVAAGLIFNINEFLSGSFVYAGAFIRPWLYYMSTPSSYYCHWWERRQRGTGRCWEIGCTTVLKRLAGGAQTYFAVSGVNLSVCLAEVGMLQPEPSSEANSLTVTPLLQSAGNHVNSVGERNTCTLRKSKWNLYFKNCVVICPFSPLLWPSAELCA